ncbi:protein of unknown function (plasmid) [Azospirillum baldaniorum]|uniref:Uncharacterized protein n=1 Tax=Azospirillum baldaniorum TaxID=1064539 RepID=A0A9P1JXR0_9PROT|nr:protein of unknown function [Azospirillum baldaniorum]
MERWRVRGRPAGAPLNNLPT